MFPTTQDELQLRNSIKLKFRYFETDDKALKQITYVYDFLKQCKNKKQAEAVLNNCEDTAQIKLLSVYGFGNLKDNSLQTFKDAIANAPTGIKQANADKNAQQKENAHIEGYLVAISPKYKKHTAGTLTDALPIMDGQRRVARHYNNGEQKLPQGRDYAEWYPKLSDTQNSAGKRFFTSRGLAGLWYTEHGTHNTTTAVWYRLDGTDWKKF